MLELLVFLLLGVLAGVVMGLIPGVHPNMILLLAPLVAGFGENALVFIVAMAVTNTITDFIPSILLGAPDAGSELAVLPGHQMLMKGYGYSAIKLTVIGGIGSVVLCVMVLPILIYVIPSLYEATRSVMFFVLLIISLVMIISSRNKNIAAFCFVFAGLIGLLSQDLPLDSTLVLFPIFTGLFGLSMLIMQLKTKAKIPKQDKKELQVSKKTIRRSIVFGSTGGIVAGLLPGVGTSQIAGFASLDRNNASFLVNIGAITTANIVLSFLALWLIENPRSGSAILVEQMMDIGFNEMLLIIVTAVAATGMAGLITLKIAKMILRRIERVDYSKISYFVICLLILLIGGFTGLYGLLLIGVCTMLGLLANLAQVRRGVLMGVLLVPTMLYFLSA
jgi:putative membrane protein